jgi:lipopolysaccharide transport system permease protein
VPIPREIVPVASVLSNCVNLVVQIGLLLAAALVFHGGANRYWLWLPLVWFLEVIFVCGMALATATLNVYVRDTRYIVESVNTVLFWLVPIFYGLETIPAKFADVYQYNPIAALVVCLRDILLKAEAPPAATLEKLTAVSFLTFLVGLAIFQKGKRAFYDHI